MVARVVYGAVVYKRKGKIMDKPNMKFQKLTPVDTAEISAYEEAIDFIFDNEDIKNVAISGAYSAGKSSVVETYKKKHPEKEFLNISLAHFEDAIPKTEGENVLEGKILNQLVHQIDPKDIPQTNFRVKRSVSRCGTVMQTIIVIILCIILVYEIKFDKWVGFVDGLTCLKKYLLWSTNQSSLLVVATIGLILLGCILYSLIHIQKCKNILKKVSVNGNEIEIFEQSNDSYFDKYLNEVLYLFEKVAADVIVFEDMDRYNSNQIFQRLREINTLVNNRRYKNKKTPLRFFYLIRDDIFASKDRTKFFDFIIPIVPILDGSNACDQFIGHFADGGILGLFDKHFLQEVSLYVDDMRILKNVYNEFQIYNARISTTEQDANKLLAIIVYKNVFPRDFADLQLGKGYVHFLFGLKTEIVKEKIKKLEEEIIGLKNTMSRMQGEVLKSKTEIDDLYSTKKYTDYYGRTKEQYVQEREQRKKDLDEACNGGIDKITKEIGRLENQIQKINTLKLSDNIDSSNIDSVFGASFTNEIGEVEEFKEIKSSDYFSLLKFLLRNGYIDETYQDFMTYFYENSLSNEDKRFLRCVTDRKAKEYTYRLKNPSIVVERLREVDFEYEETLNFDLVEYILSNRHVFLAPVSKVISQLQTKMNFEFIIQYIESEKDGGELIKAICKQWNSFFGDMLYQSRYNRAQMKKVVHLMLVVLTQDEITKANKEMLLTNFISGQSNFLVVENPKTEHIIDKLIVLNVYFREVNIQDSNKELWKRVYERNLYELNWRMIKNILLYQYKVELNEASERKILSIVLSKESECLAVYVKANIGLVLKEIINHSQDKLTDEEDTVLFVLNDTDLELGYKVSYIEKLATKINDINRVDDAELWKCLLDNDAIIYSEENILRYFFMNERKYDEALIRFINKHANKFCIESKIVEQEYGNDGLSAFFQETVLCDDIENSKYEIILKAVRRAFGSFSHKGISYNKMLILIKLKIIRMSLEVLMFMRDNYPKLVTEFVKVNCDEYVNKVIDKDSFLWDEFIELLDTDMEVQYKLELLKYTDKPISICNKNYEEQVQEYILINNLCKDDIGYLLQTFDGMSVVMQRVVIGLAKNNLEDIRRKQYPMDYKLLLEFVKDDTIEKVDRLEVVSYSIDKLNATQCKECFRALNIPEWLSLFAGKRPKFLVSEANGRILEVFKKNGWISKYSVEEGRFYRAIGLKR